MHKSQEQDAAGRDLPVATAHETDALELDQHEAPGLGRRRDPEAEKILRDLLRERSAELSHLNTELDERQRQINALFDQAEQIQDLRDKIEELELRIRALEPKGRRPKQPWKVRLGKKLAGKGYYAPWRGLRPLPRITIVTPVKNGERWIRQTIESVLAQNYPKLEYIIVDGGSTDGTLRIVNEYRGQIRKLISEPDKGMYDAIAKGFEIARGEVLGWLNADDVYEPGGLLRVGEFFRTHRRTKVIYHEDTVTMDGWRFPNVAQPRVDVYKLLDGHVLFQDGVFFRKSAYRMVGGIDPTFRAAGDFDFWLRLARMFGLKRVPGHVSSFRKHTDQISANRPAYQTEVARAREKFLARFGVAGRVRCRVIQVINAMRNGAEEFLRKRKFFWPIDYFGKPYPPGEPPHALSVSKDSQHSNVPNCPLTGRAPDQLLFSTHDTRFGDSRIHYVYYDSQSGMAMAYPPLSRDELNELYERHYSQPLRQVIEPDPDYHSPYRNFRGGNIIARNLYRLPCPWWWFNKISYGDSSAEEILRSIQQVAPADNQNVRFLDVGCFEGELLDKLKVATRWQLFGLEANAKAVRIAQEKGHRVWQAAAEDAPLVVPEGQTFEVIFLGQTMEHLDDPLAALNRLRLLLSPGGAIVLSVPNLDSKQVEFFGPTWAHWHLPYHRTLLSRRALHTMARLAGMRIEWLRTRTHPYWTTMSIQLNRLGLGAVVPHTAYFSNVMAMHSTRLTGWCRLLWDWRGRGDYLVAVLRDSQ